MLSSLSDGLTHVMVVDHSKKYAVAFSKDRRQYTDLILYELQLFLIHKE